MLLMGALRNSDSITYNPEIPLFMYLMDWFTRRTRSTILAAGEFYVSTELMSLGNGRFTVRKWVYTVA